MQKLNKLAGHGRRILKIADLAISRHLAPIAKDLQCRSGCASCCHFDVDVTAAEAGAIAMMIRTMAPRHRKEVVARLTADSQRTIAGWDRYRAKIPCPLLGSDQRCEVYANRPIMCRGYVSNDRAGCVSGFADGSHSMVVTSALATAGQVQVSMADTGVQPLARAVLAALELP